MRGHPPSPSAKVYQRVPDETAAAEGYLRIINDSGEDYLYPADYFMPLELPSAVEQALLATP